MKPVGSFIDPKNGVQILVYPKSGEAKDDAIARVRKHHGLPPGPTKAEDKKEKK